MTIGKLNRIRLYVVYGLIFFAFVGLGSCVSTSENDKIRVSWQGSTAQGVFIPRKLTEGIPPDSISGQLTIRLVGAGPSVAMLGDYRVEPETILFTPLIPFTRGLRYEVMRGNERIGTFNIPPADPAAAPKLLGMYPSQDTLPENLLKIYLHFSQPMQEGKSADYVFMIRNNSDTVKGAFLNLQPELWNEDRTMLTLWLDPGRIKRDLHPNRQLGAPLQKYGRYQVRISPNWKDQQGRPLPEMYTKSFVVTERDSLSPVAANWNLVPPATGTTQPLEVEFGEPLDYSLIHGSLSVLDENGNSVVGNWNADVEEKTVFFTPDKLWKTGKYSLRAQTVLEDLAGNNLNRPFDRDVTRKQTEVPAGEFVEIPFTIEK